MVICELCGKEISNPTRIEIAGTKMYACSSCKKMGKSLNEKNNGPSSHSFYRKKRETNEKEVISNATSIINSNLAKKGLNVQQLARILNIKESTLNKILSNKINLDLNIAQKLENYFEISLTQEAQGNNINTEDFMQDEEKVEQSNLGDLLMQKLKEKNK